MPGGRQSGTARVRDLTPRKWLKFEQLIQMAFCPALQMRVLRKAVSFSTSARVQMPREWQCRKAAGSLEAARATYCA